MQRRRLRARRALRTGSIAAPHALRELRVVVTLHRVAVTSIA
jgi:hypothetical protein